MKTQYIIFLLVLGLGPFVLVQALRWLVLPLRIKRKQALVLRPKMEPTRVEDLTPETRQFMGQIIRQFASEGYEVGANVLVPNVIPKSQAVQALLINRKTGDLGLLYGTFVGHTRTFVFAIGSMFTEGRSVETYSIPTMGTLPSNPKTDGLAVPWVKDVATLAELHRRRVRKLGRENDPRKLVTLDGALAYLERHHAEACEWMVQCGYWYVDEDAGVLRQTWKGAYLSVWKYIEPIKSWRRRRRDRRARREWVALGMDQWRPAEEESVVSLVEDTAEGGFATQQQDVPDVTYEAALRDGEWRVNRRGDAVVVQVGRPSRAEMLAVEWVRLLFVSFMVVSLAKFAWNLWPMYRIFGWNMFRFYRMPVWKLTWIGLGLVYLLLESGRLAWKVSRKPVPMTVTARPSGLAYENSAARPASGSLARGEIDGFYIGIRRFGITRQTYALLIVCYDGRRLLLLTAPKKDVLEQAVNAIKQGLGMANAVLADAEK